MSKTISSRRCDKITLPNSSGTNASGLEASELPPNEEVKTKSTARYDYEGNPKCCKKCKAILPFNKRSNQFCCKSCSATYNNRLRVHGDAFKQKQRANALANPVGWAKSRLGGSFHKGSRRVDRVAKICITCNKEFMALASDWRKTCSKECVRVGGPREGSGRAKTGYYKGVYCGSTWELAFLIWHLDHNIEIKRSTDVFEYVYDGVSHKYHPDFVIQSQNYEIKGRMTDVDHVKLQVSKAILVDQNQIKPYIQYVVSTYKVGKESMWKLYESNKLPFEYSCSYCQASFRSPKARTTVTKFCSQPCSARFNRLQAKWYK